MGLIKPAKGGVELPSLGNPAGSGEILSGYQGINGSGAVVNGSHVCAGLDETTADATAVAGDIVQYKTAYAQGQKITGTHVCPTVADLTADATAGAGDVVSGKTAYSQGKKITGSHTCPTVADLTADADATAADIVSGKTAYVDGVKVVGTFAGSANLNLVTTLSTANESKTYELDPNKTYVIFSYYLASSNDKIMCLRYDRGTVTTDHTQGSGMSYGHTTITGNTLTSGKGYAGQKCVVLVYEVVV